MTRDRNDLRGVDAANLKLWRVSIPDDDDDALRNFAAIEDDELRATRKVFKYFSVEPAEEHIHIIIEPPSTIQLSVPSEYSSMRSTFTLNRSRLT